jgi:hypothetical protein
LGQAFSAIVKEENAYEQVQEGSGEHPGENGEQAADTLSQEKLLSWEEVTTPGQAQQVLCRQDTITTEDFQKLLRLARPGNAQDAVVILYCLKHMKIYKELIISATTADTAVKKMLDSLVGGNSDENVVTPQKQVDAAAMILNNFDEDTGLYFALRAYMINKVLSVFWEGVQGGGTALSSHAPKVVKKNKKGKDKDDQDQPQVEDRHPWILLLEQLIRQLNYRRTRPYQKMKKRAARKYKRHIRQNSGTTAETIHYASQIALHVASAETVMKTIVNPCIKSRCRISEATFELVGMQRSVELNAADQASDVAVEESTVTEEEEDEQTELLETDESIETAATEESLESTDELVASADEKVASVEEPVASAEEPVASADEPVEATNDPVQSVDEPVESAHEPVESADLPVETASTEEPEKDETKTNAV